MNRRRLMRNMIIMGGTPPKWAIQFNGTTTKINCGNDVGTRNLADNAMTAEIWFLAVTDGTAHYGGIIGKTDDGYSTGWMINWNGANKLLANVACAVTPAMTPDHDFVPDSLWHHVAMTYDDAGDRKTRMFLEGTLVETSNAGNGAIVSDAAKDIYIGLLPNIYFANGSFGWGRISNSVRYVANFTPSRTPPAVDANTIAQWNMSEGIGTVVDDAEGTVGRDGTITNGTWVKWT